MPIVPRRGDSRFAAFEGFTEFGGTSIHSNPTELLINGNDVYAWEATRSTINGTDNKTWESNGYPRNIILGRLGSSSGSIINNNDVYSDTRKLGAAIYIGSSSTKPAIELSKQAMENIIKN